MLTINNLRFSNVQTNKSPLQVNYYDILAELPGVARDLPIVKGLHIGGWG